MFCMSEFRIAYKRKRKEIGGKALIYFPIIIVFSAIFLMVMAMFEYITYLIPLIAVPIIGLGAKELETNIGRRRVRKIMERVMKTIELVNQDHIKLNKTVKHSLGYIVIEEKSIRSSGSNHRNIYRKFEVIKTGKSNEILLNRNFLNKYTIMVDKLGNGYVKLPAILFQDKSIHNGLLVLVPNSTLFKPFENTFKIKLVSGDELYLYTKINRDVLNGKLIYTTRHKSLAAKLILTGKIENTKLFDKLTVEKTIYNATVTGIHNFTIRLNISEPLAIISHIEEITLRDIVGPITRYDRSYNGTIIYGFAEGKYMLRLELSLPFEPDKSVEETINLDRVVFSS